MDAWKHNAISFLQPAIDLIARRGHKGEPNRCTRGRLESSIVYTSLDRTQREVRLLRSSIPSDPPGKQYQLVIFDLKDAPPYIALSYEWGPPEEPRDIYVNGSTVSVRHNLWSFLDHTGYDWDFEWIWIDALCINQVDLEERSHQVGLMSEIYSQAEVVLAWLGPSDIDVDKAITILETLELMPKSAACSRFSKDDLEYIGMICERTYWTRLWALQELMLARQIWLCLGTSALRWSCLAIVLMEIGSMARHFIGRKNDPPWLRNEWNLLYHARLAIFRSPAFMMFRQMQIRIGTVSVLDRVLSIWTGNRYLHCAVLQDRVYALLGICKATRIWPDYTLTGLDLAHDLLLSADGNAFEDFDDFITKAHHIAKILDFHALELFTFAAPSIGYRIQNRVASRGARALCWAYSRRIPWLQELCLTCPVAVEELCNVFGYKGTSRGSKDELAALMVAKEYLRSRLQSCAVFDFCNDHGDDCNDVVGRSLDDDFCDDFGDLKLVVLGHDLCDQNSAVLHWLELHEIRDEID